MSEPLTFEVRLDADETVRALRAVRRRQRFAWVDRAIWAAAAVTAVLYFTLPADIRPLSLVGTAAFVLAGSVGPGTSWILRNHYRRMYRETPDLRYTQVHRFSDAGLSITGGTGALSYGWDSFVDAVETDEFFLFYTSKAYAHYMPKRVVRDELELRRLRQLIVSRLGERATGVRADGGEPHLR
jgi:hypothetical protein